MAQYIKPTIKLSAINNTVRPAGSCATSGEDLELLENVFGIKNWDKAFAVGEGCTEEYPIEDYCKFTSVENGVATIILGS